MCQSNVCRLVSAVLLTAALVATPALAAPAPDAGDEPTFQSMNDAPDADAEARTTFDPNG